MTRTVQRLAAETIGTGGLVVAVIGSGIMAAGLTADPALALLANAIATAAALAVLITVLGPVSGAHLNPAVTAVMALRGEIGLRDAALYAVSQIIGAIGGVVLAHAMFGLPLLQAGTTARTGVGQWLGEVVATAELVGVILMMKNRPALPQTVALYILAAYWFTSSTSFANPAVTAARALTATFTGIAPGDAVWFVVAQFAGAMLCAFGAMALGARTGAAGQD